MIRPQQLCDTWPQHRLSEVVEFLDHLRVPVKNSERTPGPYPYYGANGQQGTIDGYIFDEPLILLAEDGGHFGSPDRGIAYTVSGKCWVNNHAHVLRVLDGVDIRFLCRQLELYDVTPFISGTTRKKLTKSAASRIPVVLPPLPEQRRIAAILDKADAVRRKRQQTLDLADQFLRSTFLDLFGDPVTNPKRWPVRKLADVASITTGNTPSRKKPEYYGPGIEWIKSDNINTPNRFLTKAEETLSDEGKAHARVAGAGASLMTCIAGSRSCIGNVALADREVAFNQQINAIEPLGELDSDFLYVELLFAKRLIQAASTDAMKGLVSKGRLARVSIPVPPRSLQERLSSLFRAVLRWSASVEKAQSEAKMLFDSLTTRAFRGEL